MRGTFITRNNKFWSLNTACDLITKVKAYADKKNLKDVLINQVEDNTDDDPRNQRYDISIIATSEKGQSMYKLLMLKGEVIDGETFHKRFDEFYPRANSPKS